MQNGLSLLYPSNFNASTKDEIATSALAELQIDKLVDLSSKKILPWETEQINLANYLTTSSKAISYRLDIVEDMVTNITLCDQLKEAVTLIEGIAELRSVKDNVSNITASLYSISEIEMYTDSIDLLQDALSDAKLISEGLHAFAKLIDNVFSSAEYQNLKINSQKLMEQMRGIKSVTIGVNLDAQLRSVEAGVVAVNTESFRSGDIVDRVLRLDTDDDGFRCLTPLVPYGKRKDGNTEAFVAGVNSALDTIFRSTTRSWRPLIRRYLQLNTDNLVSIGKELRFLLAGVEFVQKLKRHRIPVCKPEVCEQEKRAFSVRGLYNPHIAFSLGTEDARNVVLNDFEFDEDGMIYLLTGANQGGKSGFTYAVGIAQLLFQLGLFVPAREAKISPADYIFTHFPSTDQLALGKGRLGEESARLNKIIAVATKHSLILMDETLSSTSAIEGTYIAGEVLTGLSLIGSRCIFATHLHDLTQQVEQINSQSQVKAKLDNLVVMVDSETGERNYKVVRMTPDGLSHAKNIAEKYGITLEYIKKMRKLE